MKKVKSELYMIGNAHLDPVWLWRWQEGYAENRATFRSVLERLGEYEDVVFTSSSAQLFEWLEQSEPELFEKIREYVRKGRIILCGGWWIQPDCNIPSGESLARQGLLGQRYFYEKFGVMSRVGYCVDSFGHNGMLPQILRLSGMESYVFMRPCETEKEIGVPVFKWESMDGSQVTAFRIPGSYCAFHGLESQIEECIELSGTTALPVMCFYGVGNHGGGPTKKNIEVIRKIKEEKKDVRMFFSSPDEYFADLEQKELECKILKGDLQHHASGCYSLNSSIKMLNRRAENELLAAEKYEMMAAFTLDTKVEKGDLEKAWKNVLFNQFHDILAGTIIKSAAEDAVYAYGAARWKAQETSNYFQQMIASRIQIEYREGCTPLVVFNPLGWNVESAVEVELGPFQNSNLPESVCVTDGAGNVISSQSVLPDAFMKERKKIVFMAELPAMGYKLYWIEKKEMKGQEKPENVEKYTDIVLENNFLRVEFSRETGDITSFYNKEIRAEILSGSGACGKVIEDLGDSWAHDILEFQKECGRFEVQDITWLERGDVRSSVRVRKKYNNSELIQIFTLYNSKNSLEVTVKLNWQEKNKCLKLEFPVNVDNARAIYEIPYGFIEKEANGVEEPMQNYFLVCGDAKNESSQKIALAVLNDGKYSGDIKGNKMSLTVLRSPAYAHHYPYKLESAENDRYIDQGWQEFKYVLVGIHGEWSGSSLARKALEINQKPEYLVESYHEGVLPPEAGILKAEPENIVVTCCKRSCDGEGWILRFYESEGKETRAKLSFGKHEMEYQVRPNEIKTLKISDDLKGCSEVNLLEYPL